MRDLGSVTSKILDIFMNVSFRGSRELKPKISKAKATEELQIYSESAVEGACTGSMELLRSFNRVATTLDNLCTFDTENSLW